TAKGMRFFDVASQCVIGQIAVGRGESMHFDRSGKWLFTGGGAGLPKWPVPLEDASLHAGPPQALLPHPDNGHLDRSADGNSARMDVGWSFASGRASLVCVREPGRRVTLKFRD